MRGRWRQQHEQAVVLAVLFLGEPRRLRRMAGARRPAELEIAIRRGRARSERDFAARFARRGDGNAVRRALDAFERHAGIERDVDRDRIAALALRTGAHHRQRNALDVGDAQRTRRGIARPDHHREAQREAPVLIAQDLLVLELHHDGFARPDVRHLRSENVRPLFVEQRGAPPVAARLLVSGARGGTLADFGFDDAFGDAQAQPVHRSVFGQRKDVHAFVPIRLRVAEGLNQARSRYRPADAERDIGGN